MWKQLTAALLILCFTSSIFCRTAIVLDYYANTAAYARDCINKARPKMRCNGKCQMMKKLEQEEKNDRDNRERKVDNKNELIFADSFAGIGLPDQAVTGHATAGIITPKPIDRHYSLLRPPVAA